MAYSFTDPLLFQLMPAACRLAPGLRKVMGIFREENHDGLVVYCISNPAAPGLPDPMAISDQVTQTLRELRRSIRDYHWFTSDELPFETTRSREVQLDVFDELERNILCLPIFNETDGQHDLLFLYFPENFSSFKISSSTKSLFPEHRLIIGSLLQNAVQTIAHMNATNRETLRQINGSTRSVIERYQAAQEELKKLTSGVQRNILDLSKHLLDEIAPGGSTRFIFSPAAAEKLKKFKGEIPELKILLQKAVNFASALEFDRSSEEIRLEEYHIDLDPHRDQQRNQQAVAMPSARYAKTVALLDKLEEAAARVQARDLPLTGVNVGNACTKSISAPAITDALKKHRAKILTLLTEYPDRWNLIRSEFKPLVNALTTKNSETRNESRSA